MRFACAVLHCLWPVRLYNIFHFISYTARFSKDMFLNIKCVFELSVQRLSDTFFTLRGNERNVIENIYRSSCNVPLVRLDFNKTFVFLTNSQKILKYRILGALFLWELLCSMQTNGRTERQTDMMKLIRVCLYFTNAPKIISEERNRISAYGLD
jgi:hypothetical protein